MNPHYKIVFILLAAMLILPSDSTAAPRYVIFMCADGMGLSNVAIARTFLYGPGEKRLSFENLPYTGYQRTLSKNSYVTDSAAAASAWASGEKFNNGEISCHDNDDDGKCDPDPANPETILELAMKDGMASGLVATSGITHATPAAWAAHVHSRRCESEIFRQMISIGIDVLLGGGIGVNMKSCQLAGTDAAHNQQLIKQAKQRGYRYVTHRSGLKQIGQAGHAKLLGVFSSGGMTPIYKRTSDCTEPTLTEMTQSALSVLEKDPEGFFLMVEGSQIDWANHDRNPEYQVHEMIDFHRAAQAVLEWTAASPQRQENTLIIVTADHECGGVLIDGPEGAMPTKNDIDTQEIYFGSSPGNEMPVSDHTAVDTLVWSNHPQCSGALENTDLFYIMSDFLAAQ